MSLRHPKTLPFMWKYHKRKDSVVILLLVLWSISSTVNADDCLYQKSTQSRPSGVLATAKSGESVSYLLKDGSYANVVEWNCSRLGKRILLVVPGEDQNAAKAYRLFAKIADRTVVDKFATAFPEASKQKNFEKSIQIDGYEVAKLIVRRSDYASEYLVEYYTSD